MAKSRLVSVFLGLSVISIAQGSATPRCVADRFKPPAIPGAKVLSITAEERHNITAPTDWLQHSHHSIASFCEVKLHLTHPGTDDKILVQTWLPLAHEDWNGRFQATGGGGWTAGLHEIPLGHAINTGYAASSTDAGHRLHFGDVSWAVKADRSIDWNSLHNFASRSLADKIYVGKSIAEQYFGTAPHHSYWNGCSQGGRQGYTVAQKYPGLLDGILAAAPALDLTNLLMGITFWPQIAMREAGTLMSNCEFEAFLIKAVEECDILDGVLDGIIEDPENCRFDPETLVGRKINCDNEEVEITATMAKIVRDIWKGPTTPFGENIGPGLPHGTPTNWLANIEVNAAGVRSPSPLILSISFIQNLLVKDPSFNTSKISYSDYLALWVQANAQYGWLLNNDSPNLEAFRDAGGKLLTWHGINDQILPYQGTVQFRHRVEAQMGGSKAVNEFYRLFLAPGVHHCGYGPGPEPKDPLQALVDWVENGEPPDRLEAVRDNEFGERTSRDLCLFPKKSKYMGIGDGHRASSWTCEGGDEEEEEEEQLENGGNFPGGLMDRLMQVGLDMGLSIG